MALSREITLTIDNYNITLDKEIKIYEYDAINLCFTIQECGIVMRDGKAHNRVMPVVALKAYMLIETPEGVDSVEATNIVRNKIMFSLGNKYSRFVGIGKMQIILKDFDGCRITLPEFAYEVKQSINTGWDDGSFDVLITEKEDIVITDELGRPVETTKISEMDEVNEVTPQTYTMVINEDGNKKIKLDTIMESISESIEFDAEEIDRRIDGMIEVYNDEEIEVEFPSLHNDVERIKGEINEIGESLDKIMSELPLLNTEYVNIGEIKLPNDFKQLPFKIYKDDMFKFSHNATPSNQFNWSGATNIYISYKNSSSGLGTEETSPISFARFAQNVYEGLYTGINTFVVNILDDIMEEMSTCAIVTPINLYIKSKSPSGFSWFGRFKNPKNPNGNLATNKKYTSPWELVENSVYKTIQYKAYGCYDVINTKDNLEVGNMPSPYLQVTTLDECKATKGTFFVESNNQTVYCNRKDNEDINNIVILTVPTLDKTFTINAKTNSTIMFENIGFTTEQYYFKGDNVNNKFYFFNCKFYRGLQDSFAINYLYQAYLFNCVASYSSKDCFNYHATGIDSLAVEVNCISYGAGKYKMNTGNSTTHSNNGSTAHNGMNVLRVGTKCWECEGAVLADVDNCYSINIGLKIGDVINSTTGHKTAYYFSEDSNAYRPQTTKKYLIECKAMKGNNEYGLVSETNNLYVGGLYGFNKVSGNINLINKW